MFVYVRQAHGTNDSACIKKHFEMNPFSSGGGFRVRKLLTLLIPLALVATAPLTAQQFDVRSGPEHAVLKVAEGTWDATARSMGNDSKGALKVNTALNGVWMINGVGNENWERFRGPN